jgi:hypothetical protein
MEFIKDLIKEYKSTIYWVAVINVILVFHNARDAFLYESTNFENDTTFIFSLVKKFNEYGCKLKITSDEFKYPRFFVYKENSWIDKDIQENPDNVVNDTSIAMYLGFHCIGHDYSNYHVQRIIIEYYIGSSQIYAEVCEINKIPKRDIVKRSNERLNSFNNVLKKYGMKVNVSINVDDGLDIRTKKLFENKKKYILKNKEKYNDDLSNNYLNDNWTKSGTFKYLQKSKTEIDENLLTVLKIIYKYVNDGLFEQVFNMYSLKEADDRILEFDECIWNYIQSGNINHDKCLNIIKGGGGLKRSSVKKQKSKMSKISTKTKK